MFFAVLCVQFLPLCAIYCHGGTVRNVFLFASITLSAMSLMDTIQLLSPLPSLDDAIRIRAYELYEARGREPGHAEEDWLRAEAEIRGSRLEVA